MTERGILYKGAMVRAIDAGIKTETRRAVVLPSMIVAEREEGDTMEDVNDQASIAFLDVHEYGPGFYGWMTEIPEEGSVPIHCPYGVPGDRLWVKETWASPYKRTERSNGCIYRADYGHRLDLVADYRPSQGWRPSIFMPRWASRFTLGIDQVRVERVQDITDEGAIAEGVHELIPRQNRGDGPTEGALAMAAAVLFSSMARPTRREFLKTSLALSLGFAQRGSTEPPKYFNRGPTPRELFAMLWDSINGRRPGMAWEDNPWVWVIAFHREVV